MCPASLGAECSGKDMGLKTLVLERIRQLSLEQAETKGRCIATFGGFRGEVLVPANLDTETDAALVNIFERLVVAKAARESSPHC